MVGSGVKGKERRKAGKRDRTRPIKKEYTQKTWEKKGCEEKSTKK